MAHPLVGLDPPTGNPLIRLITIVILHKILAVGLLYLTFGISKHKCSFSGTSNTPAKLSKLNPGWCSVKPQSQTNHCKALQDKQRVC